MITRTNDLTFTARTYVHNFIGDSDARVEVTVTRRTAKSVWFTCAMNDGEEKRAAIHSHDGHEFFFPYGRHSMAATVHANNPAA